MCLQREDIRRVRISISLRLRHLDPGGRDRAYLLSAYGTSERIVASWTRAQLMGETKKEFIARAIGIATSDT